MFFSLINSFQSACLNPDSLSLLLVNNLNEHSNYSHRLLYFIDYFCYFFYNLLMKIPSTDILGDTFLLINYPISPLFIL